MKVAKAKLTIQRIAPDYEILAEREFRPSDDPFSIRLQYRWLNDGFVNAHIDPDTLVTSGFYFSNQPFSSEEYHHDHFDAEGRRVVYPFLDLDESDPEPGVRVRSRLFGAKTVELLDPARGFRVVTVEAVIDMAFADSTVFPVLAPVETEPIEALLAA